MQKEESSVMETDPPFQGGRKRTGPGVSPCSPEATAAVLKARAAKELMESLGESKAVLELEHNAWDSKSVFPLNREMYECEIGHMLLRKAECTNDL